MKKIFLFSLMLISLLSYTTQNVSACSCMASENIQSALGDSQGVFIGTVNSIKTQSIVDDFIGNIQMNRVTFTVNNKIKWDIMSTMEVTTSANGASCWYHFETGKQYIVFAYGDGEGLWVWLCSRTSLLKDAQDDLEYLKKNNKLLAVNGVPNTWTTWTGSNILYIWILLLITLWFIILLSKDSRHKNKDT